MINRYVKGVRKERAIVNTARAMGLISFRSAGSHSPIDVCVIDIKNKTIDLIQCKAGVFSELDKKRLEEKYQELNNVFRVNFFVK